MKKFDFTPTVEASPKHLRWPDLSELGEDSGLGGNRNFIYIEKPGWDEVEGNLAWEEQVLQELGTTDDADEVLDIIEQKEDERYEDPDLYNFDIGVTSAVVALAAAGCIPFSSCNGGCFGDQHSEQYPLIAFYVRKEFLGAIIEAVEEADMGLESAHGGAVCVYSNDITKMLTFARSVLKRRKCFFN